ncbi:hypothetical protein HNR46_001778 [Haloferula luteola]|uniref:Uncharacterized protein n=1 Tax=Haloferula luteola TaxID=595692 RepID=A0A840VFG3_9BACT|nr:hypothetical protein [Haloferula luteola]MBB5351541.1 hypothetical protein [Haloferula luteola]
MAGPAKVASIEALEEFRAALARYGQRTGTALDDVSFDVKRLREWLTHDRRMAWEGEVRRRTRRWEQAKAELMTAQLSGLRDDLAAPKMVEKKAARALEEAEAKLEMTRQWARRFDGVVAPALSPLDHLRDRLAIDVPKALASLDAMIRTLDEYAGRTPQPRASSEEEGAP